MDSLGVTSTGGNKWRVNRKNRGWHKRLHLRKAANQPPTMQSGDKHRPKKIAEEWEQSTLWPSSKKLPQGSQQSQQRTNDNENPLRFRCSLCRDNLEYVPKDLVRHFEETHSGSPPDFSCHMCTFITHEFSYLQVHLLSHKNTFSSCSICNDHVQRTWPEFSAHLDMYHFQNGKYSCELCQKFSTVEVGVFLEHMYAHNLTLEGSKGDLHRNDNNFALKAATQTLRCHQCGYEVSRKLLINKDIKATHICPKDNQMATAKKGVNSIAMTSNDQIPKMKVRLTRSAVRQMCWLTHDCLSLPGREFLDKYCHLSDPQTTLEETQQFLMNSVAGETGDQKWAKALKSVLSNVPPDRKLHQMSENGVVSKSSDLTVLTVKNKITVAQNGAAYAKKLKMMTSHEKETVSTGNVADDAHRVVDKDRCQSIVSHHTSCPQIKTKQSNNFSTQSEPSEYTQAQENQNSQDLKDQCTEHKESTDKDGVSISSKLKLTNESADQPPVHKVVRSTRQNQRRKRKVSSNKLDKRASGLPLKIVLKKNPIKEKQWVSQSCGDASDNCLGLPTLQTSSEEMPQILHKPMVSETQNKWTKASTTDLQDNSEAMLQFSEMDANVSKSAGEINQSEAENVQLQTSGSDVGCHTSEQETSSAADGVTARSGYTKSSPVSERVTTPQGQINSGELSLAVSSEWIVERMSGGEGSADSGLDLLNDSDPPTVKTFLQDPSAASVHQWQLSPKNMERTLKLVAISPYQLVKRPAGDQPVVVLNHPDADIPEVARIMEVVNRYRGEVQKVVLSRRTLNALSAMNGDVLQGTNRAGPRPEFAGHDKNCVQERFLLKLKLRRLSRKKYEVVGASSSSRDAVASFRCWFCGRVFTSKEMWLDHRRRHLLEW